MTCVVSVAPGGATQELPQTAGARARGLADRLEQGSRALLALATSLSDAQWQKRVPGDGRAIGVIVHHVASVYPIEIDLATTIGRGEPIAGVTMQDVHAMNARHAAEHAGVSRAAAIDLLAKNSAAAAAAIRALDDEALDRVAVASLYDEAPVTCQFVLEDHAVRHSYHHLSVLTRALATPA
jgi:hypothetical protein